MSLKMETSSDDDDLNMTLTIARSVYATMLCAELGSIAFACEMGARGATSIAGICRPRSSL
jgi:hypothetical protein